MDNPIVTEAQLIPSEIEVLLKKTVFMMATWKWFALIFAFLVGSLLFKLLQKALYKFRHSHSRLHQRPFFHHFFSLEIEKSISWMVLTFFWLALIADLELPSGMAKYLAFGLQLLLGFNTIRLCYLAAEACGRVFADYAAKTESSIDDQLAPIATKTMKVLVVIIGCLTLLQNFGVNVTALLAGLGIGGVAIAFAAQDTVSNLFGTITILLDAPFKLGDVIKIGDTEGTVEEVGFRSTRLRTPYNSVVVFPNSMVAKERVDNLSARPQIRFRHNLGLHYNTKPEKISEFCEQVRYLLIQHPQVDKEKVIVVFNGYLDSALNILVICHFNVKTGVEELALQNQLLNDILGLASRIGVEFAYPTRTVYLQQSQQIT